MFDWFKQRVLHFMRVPHEPFPPAGAPESVRIFRAARNYYRVRLAVWAFTQLGAVVGIIFSVGMLLWFKDEVRVAQAQRTQPAGVASPASAVPTAAAATPTAQPAKPRASPRRNGGLNRRDFLPLAKRTPNWVLIVIEVFEVGAILVFIIQLPITATAVRLEYELHWYIVTDRSLRIRTGLLRLQESTMSFANLQQVEIQQGPLQRLLGLADLRVQSAGGGAQHDPQHGRESLHTGIFHGVENAAEIRDLILERLRKFRETGIGDPDDHGQHHATLATSTTIPSDALAAVHEVLAEARALRQALS